MGRSTYVDLGLRARTDPAFQAGFLNICAQMSSTRSDEAQDKLKLKMLELCDYNIGLMLPLLFPSFGGPGKGMSLFSRPYNFPMFDIRPGGYCVVRGSRQFGKCRKKGSDEPVSADNGEPLEPEQLEPGTLVASRGDDGETSTACVSKIHDSGKLPCVKVVLADGVQLELSEDHMLLDYRDEWVAAKDLKPGEHIRCAETCGVFTDKALLTQDLMQAVRARALGEDGLPSWVFDLTRADTVKLLRALWQAQGSVECRHRDMGIWLEAGSKKLARQVKALLLKLSITSSILQGRQYSVSLSSMTGMVRFLNEITSLTRNRRPIHENIQALMTIPQSPKAFTYVEVLSVESLGKHDTWDIEVDGSHNYVLSGVISHNSTSLSAKQMSMPCFVQGYESAYIAPHEEHVKTYANKYRDMERVSAYARSKPGSKEKLRSNLRYKEYPDAGRVELFRILTDASASRGKTFDGLNFDEYQLFDIRLEADVSQTQRTSKMAHTMYSGTSTTVDSPLEIRYQQSSGGVWMLRSNSNVPGQKYINCSDGSLVLKMLQPKGLTCPYTDTIIHNPLNGVLEHQWPGRLDNNIIGIHVPQFIIPEFLEPSEWAKLIKFHKDYGDTKTLQEVCGIPVEEGFREITQNDLQAMCCLPFKTSKEACEAAKKHGAYRFIVSGCDWGGSDYQMARQAKTSYTVHVILGVKGDGNMDILYMRRHSSMDYDQIASIILHEHVKMGGSAIGSDYGGGYAYNTFLHRDLRVDPTKHYVWEYQAPYTAIIKKPQFQQFPTHYMLNKTESITQLYEAIKKQRIRCYGWEEAQGTLTDILHSFRIHAETRHGRQYFLHVRNPADPDDTLHALNYAYVVARILLREPMFDDPGLRLYAQMAPTGAPGNLDYYRSLVGAG